MGTVSNSTAKKSYARFCVSPIYMRTHWGREGETDYCIKLNELSPAEQDSFAKNAKKILNKSALVHIYENTKCVHKH